MPGPIVFRNFYDQQEMLPQVEENVEQQMIDDFNEDHDDNEQHNENDRNEAEQDQMMLLINVVEQRLGIECPICFVEFPIESVYTTICLPCIVHSYVNNGACPVCNHRILDFYYEVHRLHL